MSKPDFAAMARDAYRAGWVQCDIAADLKAFSENAAINATADALEAAYAQGRSDERERCELTVLRERDSIGGRRDVRVKAACNRIATDIRNGGE